MFEVERVPVGHRVGTVLLVVGLAVLPCVPIGLCAGAWWTRIPDTAPPSEVVWSIPAADRTLGTIDLSRVHRDLWREWVVAREPESRDRAGEAICEALVSDPPLLGIAEQLLSAEDGLAAADAVALWNATLAARGAPWALASGAVGDEVYVKSSYLLARPTATFGDRSVAVGVGLRVDRLNVVESWLGLAEEGGAATVVVDRVAEFAFDVLWPLLDPEVESPLAPGLRERVAALSAADREVLTRTAGARRRMVAARDAVVERRGRCDSGFVMSIDWNGIDALGTLVAYADRDRGQACPGIVRSEAEAVAEGTLALRAEPTLPAALEALVALTAGHVVVHEARHRLDAEDWGFGTPPPCEDCPVYGAARFEASAYLAVLASTEATIGWIQGCSMLAAADGGSSVAGLLAVLEAVGTTCDAPPPADLRERARAVGERWFGQAAAGTVGELPSRLRFVLPTE